MRRQLVAYAAALFLICTSPADAWAMGWLPPVDGGTTILGFGAAYTGGTHRGVDLFAEAGAPVSSPADAVVSFAGTVPADGGGTCGAVTLDLGDGRRVSLLPLDGVSVVEGDSVRAGDPVGAVAPSGDDSSVATHVHLGLRRGDLYLDPGALLAPPMTPEAESIRQPTITPQIPTGSASTSVGGAPSSTAEGVTSTAPAVAPGGARGPITEASSGETRASEAAAAATGTTSAAVRASSPSTRGPVRDAGVPEVSAVVVRSANAMSRPSAHLALPLTRALTGWLLALGMTAVGASILVMRRASPVRVH